MPTYTLQNDQCRVRIHSYGAELASFQRRDLDDLVLSTFLNGTSA